MRPALTPLPEFAALLRPLLVATGLAEVRIGPAPSLPGEVAADLPQFARAGAPLYLDRAPSAAERRSLEALAAVADGYDLWRQQRTELDRLRQIYDHSFQLQGVLRPDGTILDANETVLALAGSSRRQALGQPLWTALARRISAPTGLRLRTAIAEAAGGDFVRYDMELLLRRDRRLTVDFSLTPVKDEAGRVIYLLSEGRDITEHLRVAREAELSRAYLQAVLENVQDGIVTCDAEGHLAIFNRASRELHHPEVQSITPESWSEHYDLYGADGCTPLTTDEIPLFRAWHGETLRDVEVVIAPRGRPRRVVLASGGPLWAEDGRSLGAAVALHDITNRRDTERRLRHEALHDRLTGLANREYLRSLLDKAIARHQRHPDQRYAVLFIDLDNFKQVNDLDGHLAGDRLLLQVGALLRQSVRQTDTVARLGGDEFAILLDAPCDPASVTAVARRILQALDRPFRSGGRELRVSASIGAALARAGYDQLDDPLRDADIAMYRAKNAGKNGVALFDQSMHEAVVQAVTLEQDLRQAIQAGQLRLYYQPILCLQDGHCAGFEALVRWQHPQRGLLAPGAFLELATETGQIVALGSWVLAEADRQLQAWRRLGPLGRLTVSVNLSDQQVHSVPDGRCPLLEFPFSPGLELEITESGLFDTPEAERVLQTLAERGVRLSLDDFGTGYASLAAVQRHPISTLKLDRSFVQPLPGGARQRAIVASVMTMAHHLDLRVIAEGLETAGQVEAVMELGCTHGQGYFYAPPLPPEQALAYALKHQRHLAGACE